MFERLPFIRSKYFILYVCTFTTAIAGLGFLWAMLALNHFQEIEGYGHIGNAERADYYFEWSIFVPFLTTFSLCVALIVLPGIITLGQKRYAGLLFLVVYSAFLIFLETVLFIGFPLAAFD